MNVFVIYRVPDNPLFEGLALKACEGQRDLLDTWPVDWRSNYRTWQPRSLGASWATPEVTGDVRKVNDYPCINLTRPAFSQRAVDILRDTLEYYAGEGAKGWTKAPVIPQYGMQPSNKGSRPSHGEPEHITKTK